MKLKYVNSGLIDELTLNNEKLWSSCIATPAENPIKVLLHFDDESNIAKDEVGNEWNVIGNPEITSINSKFNKAIYFNGSSGINTHINLNKDEDLTVDCLVFI